MVYGFVDIIDTSSHTFLSYNTILRLVDPVNRYGFAVVLQCNLENELLQGFKHLLNIMRVPPRIIFFNKILHLCVSYLMSVMISGLFQDLIQMQ
jgi:hypothetical protein